MLKFFNQASIGSLPSRMRLAPAGFRYGFLEDVIQGDAYRELIRAYPPFPMFSYVEDEYKKVFEGPYYDSHDHRGCLHHLVAIPRIWKELLHEAASEGFIGFLRQQSGIEFNSLRNFSFKYGRQGCEIKPHLDQSGRSLNPAASRLVALLYFEPEGASGFGGTCLYDTDRKKILLEAPHLRNSMVFFEQHREAWHGYQPIPAHTERHALALTFNREPDRIGIKTGLLHEFLCPRRFFRKNPAPPSNAVPPPYGN